MSGGGGGGGAEIFSTILSENIKITDKPYFENTCKSIFVRSRFSRFGGRHMIGKIVLLTGELNKKRQWKIITRPIFDSSGKIDYVTPSKEYELPVGEYLEPKTDNQLIRLRDGDLVANKGCSDFEPISNPEPWQQIPMFDKEDLVNSEKKGLRGSQVIWNSKDGEHWNYYGKADPFVIENGKYSYPVPLDCDRKYVSDFTKRCKDPLKYGWGGPGWDRQELYACPFTGYLYLTAFFRGGPYDDSSQKVWSIILLCSQDKGTTWHVIQDNFLDYRPMVMTSTPNGRLFLYGWAAGGKGRVYFSNLFNHDTGDWPGMYSGGDVTDRIEAGNIPLKFGWDEKVNYLGQIRHPSISRVSTDVNTRISKVRISFTVLNQFGRQEVKILNVVVQEAGDLQIPKVTSVSLVGTIQPKHPESHSITLGTFIDPDYVNFPAALKSNTSMFYWLEYPSTDSTTSDEVYARYVMVGEESILEAPRYISVQNGNPRSWKTTEAAGHYQTGGFFLYKGTLNYVAQWREPDGIKANIVTVKP